MYKIERINLDALFSSIAATQDLILPIRTASQTNFGLWGKDQEVDLDTLKTVKTGKDAFFPQSETLYTCIRDGKKLTVQPEELRERPFVVFGMKACDAKGIEVLDQVFLTDPVDSFYEARRTHGTIVTLACHEPEESCFCSVYGIDPGEPSAPSSKSFSHGGGDLPLSECEGALPQPSAPSSKSHEILPVTDAAAWLAGDFLYLEPVTEKGEALMERIRFLLTDADASDEEKLEEEKASIRRIVEKLPYANLSLDGWDGTVTEEKFHSPLWEDLYKPCLGCGTCTFICPTCQCYDIKDYDTGHGVQRYRCWDSCMYSDFTMMAASNNRTSQMQRFRQRFMHKLVYFPANNDGMYSCVGCGRCVEKCPESLNIVKVIKAFSKEEKESAAGGDKA